MKSIGSTILAGVAFLGLSVFAVHSLAQQEAGAQSKRASESTEETNDQNSPGIPVGEKLPEISLPQQDGREVSVQQLLKQGPVALVFYRSAGW